MRVRKAYPENPLNLFIGSVKLVIYASGCLVSCIMGWVLIPIAASILGTLGFCTCIGFGVLSIVTSLKKCK